MNQQRMTTRDDTNITSKDAPRPVGPYPHARRVGNLLFLSGIGPRSSADDSIPGTRLDEQGNPLRYDFEAQCLAVFRNVSAILDASGAGPQNVVDVTVFLTDIESDFETMNKIYADYFIEPRPCRTTVEVSRLPTPIAIELKCIAASPAE